MADTFSWIGKSQDGKQVILKRFESNFSNCVACEDKSLIRTGVVLDVETTGMNKKNDVVIEIGVRSFQFNRATGHLIAAGESYNGLQDPGVPLSRDIELLTGLTNYDLKEQEIDWKKVDQFLSKADIVIAHNASFDRPFVEKKSVVAAEKPWGCSIRQIHWLSKGFPSPKLELLSIYHGFFTGAHRALNDADALLHLLSHTDATTKLPYLNELLANARRPMVKVVATNASFESKDNLKERGYYWDAAGKVWSKVIFSDELPAETAWLEAAVYNGSFRGQTQEIPIKENFRT